MVEIITRYVKFAILVVIVWILVYFYGMYGCQRINGSEMEPTVPKDKFALVSEPDRVYGEYGRDDIIIFQYHAPGAKQKTFAARIIGLAGDRVKMKGGDVFVNGNKLGCPYVDKKSKSAEDMPEIIVPRHHYFVLCDNRKKYVRWDSRGIGPIHFYCILGKH
ncbi:MAG: signal peptidase I [Planctomycetota bacterium]